jgi:hypothetical protein
VEASCKREKRREGEEGEKEKKIEKVKSTHWCDDSLMKVTLKISFVVYCCSETH